MDEPAVVTSAARDLVLTLLPKRGVGLSTEPVNGVSCLAGKAVAAASLLAVLLVDSLAGGGEASGYQEPRQSAPESAASRAVEPAAEQASQLGPRYRQWLDSVAGLISDEERDYFVRLREDFRRDAFMEAFWQVRDPDPRTPVNELRRRFEEAAAMAGAGLPPLGDPRFLTYVLNGPPGRYTLPDGRPVAQCFSRTRELEIWFYGGSERTRERFVLVFIKRASGVPYSVWVPGESLRTTQRSRLPTTDINLLCADEALPYAEYEIARISNYDRLLEEVLSPPRPSSEWLATFAGSTTDLPAGAETFEASLQLRFPARRQSRTEVQVLVLVSLEQAPGREFEGKRYHNLEVRGEILRDGSLFESFNYRFEGETPEGVSHIPLGFTRYLRPGTITLRLLVADVYAERFAQIVEEVEVPSPEGLPQVAEPRAAEEPKTGPSLELQVPPGDLHTGLVRLSARSAGEFDKVTFLLDDKPVLSKRTPPYSVELDLGPTPEPHRIRVVGYAGDREIATDQIWLNQGNQRFRVRLIEPRPGGIYPGSLTARAEVDTPDGKPPARFELYLGDDLVAVLEQPPYVRAVELPAAAATVVRAVAYLADGTSAEDAVLVNTATAFLEAVEVTLVELYALVLDPSGKPIGDLEQQELRIYEDDAPQTLERFERASELPIQAALLVDRSSSMAPHLRAVAEAALGFARAAIQSPDDRIAVLSFAEETSLDASFTNLPAQVERALAGLRALGGTALYDGVARGFAAFEGLRGAQALLVFTDGRDEGSRFSFEQLVETARRSGVTLFALGLEESFVNREDRRALEHLAAETGGTAYFLESLEVLPAIYDAISGELRARYLLAYSSTSGKPAGQLRAVRVEVDRRGAVVRTRSGYYP